MVMNQCPLPFSPWDVDIDSTAAVRAELVRSVTVPGLR